MDTATLGDHSPPELVAFAGTRRIAWGPADEVALACRDQRLVDAACGISPGAPARIAVYDSRALFAGDRDALLSIAVLWSPGVARRIERYLDGEGAGGSTRR